MRTLVVALLLLPLEALAAEPQQLSWDIAVGATKVGTRTAKVTIDQAEGRTTRTIEAFTDLSATVGAASYRWRQRLTVVGVDDPASFTSILDEDGERRLVQAGWAGDGWRVTLGDRRGVRTEAVAAHHIDLSTADLFDPGSHWRLSAYSSAKVLSAETGDVWEGRVEQLGLSTVEVAGQPVEVQGWAWWSPEGRQTYWYDASGWLVRFETRLLGQAVSGTLAQLPPRSPDDFQVEIPAGTVEATEL